MSFEKSSLPVPDFDLPLEHSFKKKSSTPSPKPPKLTPNTRYSPSWRYQVISFLGSMPKELKMINESVPSLFNYFDKCFVSLAKIGEGSFSEVFKVRSKDDGKLYAIKKSIMPYRNESSRVRAHNEVRHFETFSDCENCVTLYKAWEQNGHLFIQLELCKPVDSYMRKLRNVTEDFYWNVFLDILLAVKALHDRDLIHLDIKLDNILIDDDKVCKLGDFGLVTSENKLSDATEGDSRYIAPELMKGIFSKAADIFSLGVTMLELITNLELPTNGPLWHELRQGKLPPVCVQRMSVDFVNIIGQMMTPSPDQRPDVETLLRWPQIKTKLENRKKGSTKIYEDQFVRVVPAESSDDCF